jgi:hypothetical protein
VAIQTWISEIKTTKFDTLNGLLVYCIG